MTLLDTSAILALADRNDRMHGEAIRLLDVLVSSGETFLIHSYILGEAAAILQRRLGRAAAIQFLMEADAYEVEWIDGALHREVVAEFERTGSRSAGIVDCASFVIMRRRNVRVAFTFDADFRRRGFQVVGEAT